MVGKYKHSVDPKGRLFVPAKLKDELGESFYVSLGSGHCLKVYPEAEWNAFVEKSRALPVSKTPKMRLLFANTVKCEPDKQGRFLIPSELRDYARLKQDVMFIGQGSYAEIWDADDYYAMETELLSPEMLQSVMEELNF